MELKIKWTTYNMISSIMRFVTIKYNVQFEFVDQKTPISWTVHHRLAHDFDKTANFYALDGFDYDDSKKKRIEFEIVFFIWER